MDPAHVEHDKGSYLVRAGGKRKLGKLPDYREGALRILGNPKYPNSPGNPAVVATLLRQLRQAIGHIFWPDRISLLDPQFTVLDHILFSRQVTDAYLLSLAAA